MSKTTKKTAVAGKSAALAGATPEAEANDGTGADDTGAAVSLQVKKKDFVERVALRSGAKKPVARDLTEAVLATLGEALSKGESLILPPLGKIAVSRRIDKAGGEVLQVKLRRMSSGEAAKKNEDFAADPLAEAED
ncbi:HU family DNA-binding protein [Rhodobacter capsulatus]|uniref:HU family DNA-binding protein n=1 Tax=Rhodobacter capsulatus TaxID=1061 RepID=UPI004028E52F